MTESFFQRVVELSIWKTLMVKLGFHPWFLAHVRKWQLSYWGDKTSRITLRNMGKHAMPSPNPESTEATQQYYPLMRLFLLLTNSCLYSSYLLTSTLCTNPPEFLERMWRKEKARIWLFSCLFCWLLSLKWDWARGRSIQVWQRSTFY
jgi:hypothetical protein